VTEVVRVSNARKRFGNTVALGDLSLTLYEGECLGLVGPNGAGKTTTIRAICGTVPLDSGTITWSQPRALVPPSSCHPPVR